MPVRPNTSVGGQGSLTASRLLGYGRLTVPQEIGIRNFLASAYVALGERSLAVKTFRRAIELQPEMELSSITNSPKILDAFNEAKRAVEREKRNVGKVSKPNGISTRDRRRPVRRRREIA